MLPQLYPDNGSCNAPAFEQVPLPEFPPHPTARSLTKTDSTSSRCSQQPTLFGMTGQSCDTQPPPDKACSSGSNNGERSSIGEMRGSSGGGCGSSSGGLHGSSSGCGSSDSSCPGPMLMSAGLDGRVIQWDLSGGGPAAVQSVLATAGADAGSELTAMAHLQVASILVTGTQCCMWQSTAAVAVDRCQAFCVMTTLASGGGATTQAGHSS